MPLVEVKGSKEDVGEVEADEEAEERVGGRGRRGEGRKRGVATSSSVAAGGAVDAPDDRWKASMISSTDLGGTISSGLSSNTPTIQSNNTLNVALTSFLSLSTSSL